MINARIYELANQRIVSKHNRRARIKARLRALGGRTLIGKLIFYALLAVAVFATSRSDAANIDSRLFVQIIACESSWHHNSGDGGKSFGLPQFKPETFTLIRKSAMRDPEFVRAFKEIEPKIRRPVFRYPSHKMIVAQWGMSNGYGKHWACYRKLAR